ncbi:TetR/AcrR family transcriptional regulator [Blastococcus sp. SYSU D00695]
MPRPYSMERRQQAATEIQRRILEAALDEVAAANGEVTLQAVAARADVALRTLYNHFAGRDQLLAAAFRHHAEQTRIAVDALTVPDADPEQQLRHVVEAYHQRYARMGARLSALLALRGYPELDHQVREIRAQRTRRLGQVIDRAEQAGILEIPPSTAIALAYTLTSHAGWQTLCEQVHDGDGEATRLANEMLCSALFHH